MVDLQTLLPMALLLPLAGLLAMPLLGRAPMARDAATMLVATVLFVTVYQLLQAWQLGETYHLALPALAPALQLAFHVEPLGLIFALVASFLWIVTTLYAVGYMNGNQEKHQTRFYACFAVAIFSAMGIAFAENLFTLFLFYELMTLSTYPLVTHSGTDKAKQAGRTYLGILMGTSVAFLLMAMVWTYYLAGTLDFRPGGIIPDSLPPWQVGLLLALFMYGIGKAALMPIHRWLPAAMVAPTPVSALLHAVAVVKAGVFTVVKVMTYVFGTDNLYDYLRMDWWSGGWLVYIAGATVLLASLVALRQDNLKRRLAYSTVSQLSYVTMAAALFHGAGVVAAALHIAAHAFGKITLFFTAGSIYTASKKSRVSELNGIARRMPVTMVAFAIGALSMIGVPPTVGFISKWYLLTGAMSMEHLWVIFVVVCSTLLNAAYFLPVIYAAFFKPETVKSIKGDHGEAPVSMVIAVSVTATGVLALFFWPDIFWNLAKAIPL